MHHSTRHQKTHFGAGPLFLLALAVLFPTAAFAHEGAGVIGGFQSGFLHPITGYDHLLAMLAVGIWGAQMGGRSVWMLPVVFPLVMAVGGFFGAIGVPLPHVELLIALSVLGLGAAIALQWKAPEMIAVAAVGIFAVFHGHAHGAELPGAADPVAYGIGFVVATGLIHLAGIGFGLLLGKLMHGWVSRAAGAAIAIAGVSFLVSAI